MRLGRKGKVLATGAAALMMGGALAMTAGMAPATADGSNGEVRGYLWPGGNGTPNWEGTYRMADGSEAWCASVWDPEPVHANQYSAAVTLTKNDGSALSAAQMRTLAYVVSTASDAVIGKTGKSADDHAAAASVIIHNLTNAVPADYSPEWPLTEFDAGTDPLGTGQQTTGVRGVYDALLADAAVYGGPWKLTWDAAPDAGVGDDVELTGTLATESGTPVPGREVEFSLAGIDGAATATTDASGRFSVTGTVTDSEVSATAAAAAPAETVMMRRATDWNTAKRPQNMIVLDDSEISAKLAFTATTPTTPSIRTSAHDQADGDKIIAPEGGTVVDVVSYQGLSPGMEYTVSGELMDQATGEGTGIKGTATFTPEAAEGTVEVAFEIPAGHDGEVLTAFEWLYDAEGELVASHEDLEDAAQTVGVGTPPTNTTLPPSKDNGTPTNDTPTTEEDTSGPRVETGGSAAPAERGLAARLGLAALAAMAAAGAFTLVASRRRGASGAGA